MPAELCGPAIEQDSVTAIDVSEVYADGGIDAFKPSLTPRLDELRLVDEGPFSVRGKIHPFRSAFAIQFAAQNGCNLVLWTDSEMRLTNASGGGVDDAGSPTRYVDFLLASFDD
jgi:hypothetical protein